MDPPQIFLRGDLGLPLEGREGLGHEKGRGEIDGKSPLFAGGVVPPGVDDLSHQVGNGQHVLVGLGGQAQHKVELDVVPPAGEGRGAGGENLLLGDVFIDGVPQALAAGLGGEGQAALADPLDLEHQLPGEIIGPQRRQRQVDALGLAVVQKAVGQGLQMPVVRGREAGEGDLVVA